MVRECVMALANVIPGLGVLYFRLYHLSIFGYYGARMGKDFRGGGLIIIVNNNFPRFSVFDTSTYTSLETRDCLPDATRKSDHGSRPHVTMHASSCYFENATLSRRSKQPMR